VRSDPAFVDWSELSPENRADLFMAQLAFARSVLEDAQEGLVHARDFMFARDPVTAARMHALALMVERAVEDLDAGGWPGLVRELVLEARDAQAVLEEQFPDRTSRLAMAIAQLRLWEK
jgi:hypothetical protein